MNAARVALLVLSLSSLSCTSTEAQLQTAKDQLDAQLAARRRIVEEAAAFESYRQRLLSWRHVALDSPLDRPRLPMLPVSLEPTALAPLSLPELPSKPVLESKKAQQLRAEIAAAIAQARQMEKGISNFEEQKLTIGALIEETADLDRSLATADQKTLFDLSERQSQAASEAAGPDAGTMKRLDQ